MNAFAHRHYEILAKLLGESVNLGNFQEKLLTLLEEDNKGKFDRERFLRAIDKARLSANIEMMNRVVYEGADEKQMEE